MIANCCFNVKCAESGELCPARSSGAGNLRTRGDYKWQQGCT